MPTAESVNILTFSERVLCCFMGTMLWCHSYCAGGLPSALHSRKRTSPSDTAWDWGWWVISSPLTEPGKRLLLQPDMTTFIRTSLDMPWYDIKQTRKTKRIEETDRKERYLQSRWSEHEPTERRWSFLHDWPYRYSDLGDWELKGTEPALAYFLTHSKSKTRKQLID